jgi:asparagine synthase (glutamine-hydrolysing)
MDVVKGLRERLIAEVAEIGAKTDAKSRVLILSGGVDTCAILEAATEAGVTFECGVTVSTGAESPDKDFAAAAAAEKGLQHHVIHLTSDDLVKTYLPACVKLLNTFDGMTLRNSLVVAAAFQRVRDLGYKDAVVGDGADELFGGYSFMWGCADDEAQWKEKRDSICARWTFATGKLAELYGITVHSPYMQPSFVQWAIDNTTRSDCIGTHPIRLTYGGGTLDHETGKVCLRLAFATVASWRRKDPIEVGSGVTVISKDSFWSARISDETFAAESTVRSHGTALARQSIFHFAAGSSCCIPKLVPFAGPFGARICHQGQRAPRQLPVLRGCVRRGRERLSRQAA